MLYPPYLGSLCLVPFCPYIHGIRYGGTVQVVKISVLGALDTFGVLKDEARRIDVVYESLASLAFQECCLEKHYYMAVVRNNVDGMKNKLRGKGIGRIR